MDNNKDDKTQDNKIIINKDNKVAKTDLDKTPQTGDNSNIFIIIGCAVAALAVSIITVLYRKNK